MRCIPRELLIHSAQVVTPEREDCFGRIDYGEAVQLQFIRVDPVSEEGNAGFNVKNTGQSVLIYDCSSSLPREFEFKQGQRITWEERLYGVVAVKKLYDKSRLHHIEVTMEEI